MKRKKRGGFHRNIQIDVFLSNIQNPDGPIAVLVPADSLLDTLKTCYFALKLLKIIDCQSRLPTLLQSLSQASRTRRITLTVC